MSWTRRQLSTLLTPVSRAEIVVSDKVYKVLGARWYAGGLYIKDTLSGASIQAPRVYRVERGDFVYNRLFAWKGSFALVGENVAGCYVSNEFPCFRINETEVDPRYLFAYFSQESVWDEAFAGSTGGTPTSRNRLKEARLLELSMPLPPIEEQRRIVAELFAITQRIEIARTLRRQADEQTTQVLAALAEEAIAELEANCPAEPLSLFDPVVSSGPRNWGERYSDSSGFRFYRAQDLTANGSISEKSKVFVEPPVTQAQAARLVPGDVLIVITGATVGRCAVFTDRNEPGMVSQHVAVCRLPQDRIAPTFVRWALLSRSGQEQLLGQKYGQGKPGLNLTNIRNVRIPVPPMDIQLATVAKLDEAERQVEALRRLQITSSSEIEALTGAILNNAFNGARE